MSTRASIAYARRGQYEFHLYHEYSDEWNHVEVEIGRWSLNVCVWLPLRYWHQPRWLARLLCRVGKHDGLMSRADPLTYTCTKDGCRATSVHAAKAAR